jgi:hypothetical protein
MAIVLFVLDKKHKDIPNYKCIGEIAHKCIVELRELTQVNLTSKWEHEACEDAEATPHGKADDHKGPKMRDFSVDGVLNNPAAVVNEKGFHVGQQVFRKADKIRAVILQITPEQVIMQTDHDGLQVSSSSASFANGEWANYDPKPEPIQLQEWQKHAPSMSLEFKAMRVKGKVFAELHDLGEKYIDVLQHLKVFVKPKKQVCAAKAFDKHKLVLVPSTLRVDHMASDADVPSGAINLGVLMTGPAANSGEISFMLMPSFAMPKKAGGEGFISPYWLVETTHIAGDENMELHMDKDMKKMEVKIPVLWNKRAIKADEKLVVYLAKQAPKTEALEEVSAASKKRRVAK